ncbi:2,3-di-O-geranylgeranylglyceryl phosphate reductase [Halogeometricum borinquense DSM 11551]|uniref:2,3-di-O-geranylgeranylglyceryl phosphate reductase n=2 Tax=Halogeometricum borinquense TaxID=60847 RepID=E4NQU9_HALBP|nr:geranylgeranyl reductase family protein [Halogeometricum borinquense]ADQ67896.1 2,3-di-O-geranylgeranylglyceryl phosphate reductase [Halogeometricum borinquense DSM 11551]ELY24184.1 2,3-di-O-geranylgeranylglyceryl phosphate reductase [Halogeometricum borinquense DSM 11551]RYJ13203.1 geranylgeranyl reductase family protein [Halogeometricum borinquense]
MPAEAYDMVVVGGGTAGAFAAATAASEGLDVVLLERKSEEEAGHIACGDAIKGTSTFPDVIDLDYLKEESFTNQNITRAVFENPRGDDLDVPFRGAGAVVDRKRYGEVILEEADRLGTDMHYDTVVQDVSQDDDGRVTGVRAKRNGDVVEYEADVTIDGAGALSILQDKTDFSGTTFDTNVSYSQFCSAYREVIDVPEPVDYDDAIVFKPTEELGYLWYFPRSPTEINAGLGFQMTEEPMKLVDDLKRDLRNRPEFEGGTVTDKLGAALPTRRPYDSAVAPGFIAAGDSAGHVNPTTGGGIPGAAKSAHWAAKHAVKAISDGDVSEASLWEYNRDVMTDFGKRFAAVDLYNIWGMAHDVDELVEIVSSLPGQQLLDSLSKGSSSMGLGLQLQTLVKTFGHWDALYELYRVRKRAKEITTIYNAYPSSPRAFEGWQDSRDSVMDDLYDLVGTDPKY